MLVAQREAPLTVERDVAGVAQPIEGKVAFVDNAVDTHDGTVKLRAEFANAEHLLWPGQLVSISLTLGHDANAVVVPDRAVQNGPGRHLRVRRQARQHAEQRKVVVARMVENSAVIERDSRPARRRDSTASRASRTAPAKSQGATRSGGRAPP